jgi:hypothetical protein
MTWLYIEIIYSLFDKKDTQQKIQQNLWKEL